MAIHTDLDVYKLSMDLLRACTTITRNMPRDYKATLGRRIFAECIDILVLIQRANIAQNKVPHLVEIMESVSVIEALLRLALDMRDPVLIAPKQFGVGAKLCAGVGRQVNSWKNWARKNAPAQADSSAAAQLRALLDRLDQLEALRMVETDQAGASVAAAPAA
jgi:hypothetical protein